MNLQRIKSPAFYLLAGAFVLEIIAMILYATTGLTQFTEVLSERVFIFGIISTVVCAVVVCLRVLNVGGDVGAKLLCLGLYVAYLFGLLAFLFYVTSEINYIVNVFVAIDGNSFTVTFILTVLCLAFAWISALVSAITYKPDGKSEKEATDENA